VFLAGTFIGSQIRSPKEKFHMAPIVFNLNRFSEHLTKGERTKVRKLIKVQGQNMRARYTAVREAAETVSSLIMAEEIDREALEAAMHEHRKRVQDMHIPMQSVLLEMVMELEYATRQKLGADMFKYPDRVKRRGGHRPPPHPPEHFREGDGRPYPPPEGRRHPPREEYLEKHPEPDPNL